MTRTRSRQANSRILQLLRPAGGWLLILMVLTLALPTACSFVPGPQGGDIQLGPSALDSGPELPGALIEAAGQQKQPPSNLDPLVFGCGTVLSLAPAKSLPSRLAAPELRPRTQALPLAFSARPPPRS